MSSRFSHFTALNDQGSAVKKTRDPLSQDHLIHFVYLYKNDQFLIINGRWMKISGKKNYVQKIKNTSGFFSVKKNNINFLHSRLCKNGLNSILLSGWVLFGQKKLLMHVENFIFQGKNWRLYCIYVSACFMFAVHICGNIRSTKYIIPLYTILINIVFDWWMLLATGSIYPNSVPNFHIMFWAIYLVHPVYMNWVTNLLSPDQPYFLPQVNSELLQ